MSEETAIPTEAPVENTEQSFDSFEDVQQVETTETTPEVNNYSPREVTFDLEGKQYHATEEMLKKYYGWKPEDQITDREWKTMVSNYKQGIQYNNKNREASYLKKTAEEAFRKLYETPKDTLKLLFKDNPQKLRQEVEALLLEELEEEMLEPTERELRQTKRLLAEKEAKEKAILEEQQRQQMQQLEAQYAQEVEKDIIGVLDSSGLPKNKNTVQRIAYYLQKGLAKGMELKAIDVVPLVKEDLKSEIESIIGSADANHLMTLLGEDKLKLLRQEDLKRVKGQAVQSRQSNEPQVRKVQQSNHIDMRTLRERAREKLKNLA